MFAGCDFSQLTPEEDRQAMVARALEEASVEVSDSQQLTLTETVRLALCNNFDLKAAQLEIAYLEESRRGSMLRLLPQLQAEANLQTRSHPDASYSESMSGSRALDYSYSRDKFQAPLQGRAIWNVLDFGAGYLRARQTGERVLQSAEQLRRLRQQTAMQAVSAFWRADAAGKNATDAAALVEEMETQLSSIRAARERGILSEAEAARRELAILGGIVEAERWMQEAESAHMELARVLGVRQDYFNLAADSAEPEWMRSLETMDLAELQRRALDSRPELFQSDSQARISLDDARLAVLQMAPNVGISMAFEYNDDKHLLYNDWFTAGLRISWNLLSLPARLSDKKSAQMQHEALRQKNLAMSAAILAQVGLARGEWQRAERMHNRMSARLKTRSDLVDSLAMAEKSGQARSAEVLQERIRLLNDRAAARRQAAEIRAAIATLASAIGLEVDEAGNYRL